MKKRLNKYIKQVLANKQGRHGEMEVLKVQRHVNDLKRKDVRFNEKRAARAIRIIENLKLFEDRYHNKRFELMPHQVFFYASILGWEMYDPESKSWKRKYRKSYKSIARKNGKTTENAALEIYCFRFDGVYGAQCFSAANSRKQALICHDTAKNMLDLTMKGSARLSSEIRIMAQNVVYLNKKSKMEAMAADPKKLDGFNPSFASIDEFHEMKTTDIIKIFERGMVMREEPILSITTTAGFDKHKPCFKYQKVCEQVLRGTLTDDTLFVDIFKLDDEDDVEDFNNWYKANPMLGHSISLTDFKNSFNSAKNEGLSSLLQFYVKNLNMWTSASKGWIPDSTIKENMLSEPVDKSEPCFIGVDLAAVSDIAGWSVMYPPSDFSSKYRFRTTYYIPLDTIDERSKSDGVPYREWADKGLINIIDSNVIELSEIKADILKFYENNNVKGIGVDPWNGREFVSNIADHGIDVGFFYQSMKNMAEPTKKIEKLMLKRECDIGEDPIKRWNYANVELHFDHNGEYKPAKDKSTEKIDGVIMDIIAIGVYLDTKKEKESVYEKQGIRSI